MKSNCSSTGGSRSNSDLLSLSASHRNRFQYVRRSPPLFLLLVLLLIVASIIAIIVVVAIATILVSLVKATIELYSVIIIRVTRMCHYYELRKSLRFECSQDGESLAKIE